jgi:flap endonuclease-1
MPEAMRHAAGEVDEVRRIYLEPAVTDRYTIDFSAPDRNGVVDFLCGQRQFSRDRVTAALDRAFREPSLF